MTEKEAPGFIMCIGIMCVCVSVGVQTTTAIGFTCFGCFLIVIGVFAALPKKK